MFRRHMLAATVLALALAIVCTFAHSAFAQVGQVTVRASLARYMGPCPAHLRFNGRIEITGAPVTLNYEWERSDGARSPRRVVTVRNSRQRYVTATDSWTVGAKGQPMQVWVKLRVRSGRMDETAESPRVEIRCR